MKLFVAMLCIVLAFSTVTNAIVSSCGSDGNEITGRPQTDQVFISELMVDQYMELVKQGSSSRTSQCWYIVSADTNNAGSVLAGGAFVQSFNNDGDVRTVGTTASQTLFSYSANVVDDSFSQTGTANKVYLVTDSIGVNDPGCTRTQFFGFEPVLDFAIVIANPGTFGWGFWNLESNFFREVSYSNDPIRNMDSNRRIYLNTGHTGFKRLGDESFTPYSQAPLNSVLDPNPGAFPNIMTPNALVLDTFYRTTYDNYAENSVFLTYGPSADAPTVGTIPSQQISAALIHLDAAVPWEVTPSPIVRSSNKQSFVNWMNPRQFVNNEREQRIVIRARRAGFVGFHFAADEFGGSHLISNIVTFYTLTEYRIEANYIDGSAFIYLLFDFQATDWDFTCSNSEIANIPSRNQDTNADSLYKLNRKDIWVTHPLGQGKGKFIKDETLELDSSELFTYIIEEPGNFCFQLFPDKIYDYFQVLDSACTSTPTCYWRGPDQEFDVDWTIPEERRVRIRYHEQTECVIMLVEDYFDRGTDAWATGEHYGNFRQFTMRMVRGNRVTKRVTIDFKHGDPFLHMRNLDPTGGKIYWFGESDVLRIDTPENQNVGDFGHTYQTNDYQPEYRGVKRVLTKNGQTPYTTIITIYFIGDKEHELIITLNNDPPLDELNDFDDFADFTDFEIYDYDDYLDFSNFADFVEDALE